MLINPLTAEQYRLFNSISSKLPALFTPECEEGLARLKLMLQEPHLAVGYYQKYGSALSIVCLGFNLPLKHRNALAQNILEDLHPDCSYCGWWFELTDIDSGCPIFAHYYISL